MSYLIVFNFRLWIYLPEKEDFVQAPTKQNYQAHCFLKLLLLQTVLSLTTNLLKYINLNYCAKGTKKLN